MSDKELSDYIKTIDPKFNSNLEKGTIEMTNEYYNLLEEYISRLNYKKDLYESVLDKIKEVLKDPDKDGFDEDGYDDSYYDMIYTQRIYELLEEIE